MDRLTNGQTHPLIESRLTTKIQYFKNTKKIRIFKKVRFIQGDFRSNFFILVFAMQIFFLPPWSIERCENWQIL